MDGWVTIGTKLDSTELEKDLKKAERKIQQYEREAEKLTKQKLKAEVDLEKYYEMKNLIEENTNSSLKYAQTEQEVNHQLELEKKNIEQLNESYSKQLTSLEEINKKIKENARNQGLLTNKVQEMTEELKKTKAFEKMKKNIDDVGSSVQKVTKKIGRWALAIFGIRSAYLFIRQAMSTLSQYNEELANQVSSIKLVLATALEPIINRIINLVITLLNYLNYLTKAWFGLDLFARASELSSKKMADNLGSGAKSAKEIKKQLASFDEMNVLQDNQANASGGGAGSGTTPEFNLPEVEIPEWIKWIAEHGALVRKIIEGIGTAILILKSNLDLLQGVGIFLILDGIVKLIGDLKDYLNDKCWEKFANVLRDIGEILVGIGITLGSTIFAVIGQVVITIAGLIDYIPSLIDFLKDPSWDKFVETIKNATKSMGILGMAIDWIVENVFGGWNKIMAWLEPVYNWVMEHIIEPIKSAFGGLWDKIKEIFAPFVDFFKSIFTTAWENIKIVIYDIGQIFVALWDGIKLVFSSVGDFFKNIFTEAYNKIKQVFEPIVNFFSNLWDKIKEPLRNFGVKVGEIVGGAFKGAVNGVLNMVEKFVNAPIKAINALISVINAIPGINIKKLNTLSLPRLAKGGIINMPGRGVPVGSAIAGERGQEAVLPLTDSQQMALLGEAIGKYITINANITNTMNGRVISRELQRINNESDFAFNR